jgi:hypothetical protein
MAESRFLKLVHGAARRAAQTGDYLDAYRVADELRAQDSGLNLTRRAAADNVIAAGLIYGAQMWIDPEPVPAS